MQKYADSPYIQKRNAQIDTMRGDMQHSEGEAQRSLFSDLFTLPQHPVNIDPVSLIGTGNEYMGMSVIPIYSSYLASDNNV